jgi:hypothetical protein
VRGFVGCSSDPCDGHDVAARACNRRAVRVLALAALLACTTTAPPPIANAKRAEPKPDPCGCLTVACRRRDAQAYYVALACETARRMCACETGACTVTVDNWRGKQISAWEAEKPEIGGRLNLDDARADRHAREATRCAGEVRDPMGGD